MSGGPPSWSPPPPSSGAAGWGNGGWGSGPGTGGPDTGDRLRAALHARSAQVGDPSRSYDPGAYATGDPYGNGAYSPGPSGAPAGRGAATHGPQRRLVPTWARAAMATGLVLSAVVGAGLGLRSSSEGSASAALPPPRETSYGDDRARVAITGFTRQDRFVTLELELTNLAPAGSPYENWSVGTALGASSDFDLSGIRLLDPASGTSIRVAEDPDGECICTSTTGLSIYPQASTRVSAQFPAPQTSVEALTVDIPGAGSFRDVPLAD